MPICPVCEKYYEEGCNYCPECGYDVVNGASIPIDPQLLDRVYGEAPTLWQWYFCKHPRVLILVPIFLYFVISGIGQGISAITDIIYFFQIHTWGALGLTLIFGTIMIPVFFVPAILAFYSIKWLYSTHTDLKNAWAKFGLSIFLVFVVPSISNFIRYFYLSILGIPEKYNYVFLPFW